METSLGLLEQIKKKNQESYPIDNLLLKEKEEYFRKQYVTHLALVLIQGEEISEEQKYLFSRMIFRRERTDENENWQYYIKKAYEETVVDYFEFMESLREDTLRYRFLMDSILLACCCEEQNESQLELIAAFMETLRIPKTEAEYLCKMAKSILEQDEKLFWELRESETKFDIRAFEEYTKPYTGKYSCKKKDDTLRIIFDGNSPINNEFLIQEGIDVSRVNWIIIKGGWFDLSERDFSAWQVNKLTFAGCRISGGQFSILLSNISNVVFHDCVFTNSKKPMIKLESGKLTIRNCVFKNCYSELPGTDGIINMVRCDPSKIENSIFENCGLLISRNFPGNAGFYPIISWGVFSVENSIFRNCKAYKLYENGSKVEVDNPLFWGASSQKNCSFINSAEFLKNIGET